MRYFGVASHEVIFEIFKDILEQIDDLSRHVHLKKVSSLFSVNFNLGDDAEMLANAERSAASEITQ